MQRFISFGLAAFALSMSAATALRAEPSILFDGSSGHVIESDNPDARWYPASLTKLMTTYVVFTMLKDGEITLQSPIRMSKNAVKEPPSKMGYKVGSELTVDNALKIIMVKSANDVAAAIGDSLGGSAAGFAVRMNAEAQKLGMTGSHWVNANGLHDDGQYTTARDLAVLAFALRHEFPQFAGYFSIEGIIAGKSMIPSHNTLIGRFDGADGMKTGYTCPSGFNLVASATRDGRTMMAVVVGSKSVAERAEKAAAMLVRGFSTSTIGAPTLETLPRVGTNLDQVTNMYDELCSKEARARAATERADAVKADKAKADQNEDDAAVEKSLYLKEMTRPPRMITVSLGGATGPVPKALADLAGKEDTSDIPLPTWRPDRPAPVGAMPVMVQGTAATSVQ